MEILPAVDIRGRRAVRLMQGDYDRETVFDDDPVTAARRWLDEGAERLHIVDLDGAREGTQANAPVIERIADLGAPMQVGGGVRTLAAVERYLAMGAGRVIIGTAAVADREFLAGAVERYGEAVVVSIDARGGRVAVEGWTETSEITAAGLAAELTALGVRRFIYTDIKSDGMLGGHDMEAFGAVAAATGAPVIAAGGISSAEDIRALRAAGASGAVLGRALYEGRIALREALEAAAC